MKSSRAILVSLLALAGFSADAGHRDLLAAPPDRSQDPGGYAIGLQVSQADGRSTWRYTIDKSSPATKDLGHFILGLDSCGDQGPAIANIVSATVDGADWSNHLEASEGRTGCDVAERRFVKFDELPAADTHVVEFTLDGIYPPWTRPPGQRGRSCTTAPVLGPGCRGYVRTSAMEGRIPAGKLYGDINTYMRRLDSITRSIRTVRGLEEISICPWRSTGLFGPPRSASSSTSIPSWTGIVAARDRGPAAQRDEVDQNN
jgi:hypothetical protein